MNITIPGGTTKRLLTAGKYCPSDILVTAEGSSGSRLPDGYTELEYIESSGTQHIDSGFIPNQDTRVVCKAQYTDTSGSEALLGSRYSTSKDLYDFVMTGGVFYSVYNNNTGTTTATATASVMVIDKNKNITSIDGVVFSTQTYASFQCPGNLLLFANNTNNTPGLQASAKLYSCQIYDNGLMVRDFVPCVNDSGEVGLYDLVGKQFYGNAGTGAFSKPGALPTLTNPASAENIEAGFEAIDGAGAKIVGSLVKGFTKVERLVTHYYPSSKTEALCSIDPEAIYIASIFRATSYYGYCLIENGAIAWETYQNADARFTISGGNLNSKSIIAYCTVWKISK